MDVINSDFMRTSCARWLVALNRSATLAETDNENSETIINYYVDRSKAFIDIDTLANPHFVPSFEDLLVDIGQIYQAHGRFIACPQWAPSKHDFSTLNEAKAYLFFAFVFIKLGIPIELLGRKWADVKKPTYEAIASKIERARNGRP